MVVVGKIFGIGLPKTGQTSLATAMWLLGYKTKQYPWTDEQIKNNDFVLDIPVALNFKKLDKKYPNSKFIMTTRDYASWIASLRNHYRRFPASKRNKVTLGYRLKFWGIIHFNKRKMTQKYYKHIDVVNKYFKKRERDLLIINIIDGEGWKKLCPFLGKKIPKVPFPKENIGVYRK